VCSAAHIIPAAPAPIMMVSYSIKHGVALY
jgi:hypothetical protein